MDADATTLIGTRVRRIDALEDGLLALTLHGTSAHGVLIVGLAERVRGVGWIERRPSGRAAGAFALQCKSRLEGARVTSIAWLGEGHDALRLSFERGGETLTLVAELRGASGDARLLGSDGTVVAAMRSGSKRVNVDVDVDVDVGVNVNANVDARELVVDWAVLHAEGERLLESHAALALDRDKRELARALRNEARREQRKLTAIEGDMQRVAEVPALRQRASLVLSHLHALAKDATEAELLDYTRDPPETVVLHFDPKLGPKLEAETWFRRARKLERGAVIAGERANAARARLATLLALAERAAAAVDREALDRVAVEARPFGIGSAAPTESATSARGTSQAGARLPYREFVGSGGRPILVGRGAAANDRLTLDHARPHDLWLHARDESGAHVVVPLKRDEACPPELLCDAATLTAHFSQARGQARVDVIYTQRRYVRKPRKAAIGSVQLMREKVFALRLEPERLRRLLESERVRRG